MLKKSCNESGSVSGSSLISTTKPSPSGLGPRAVTYYLVLAFRTERTRQREYFAEAVLELVSETYERGVDQMEHRREALMSCLQKLTAEQRGVIDRCYARSEPIVAVAEQMGLTPGALRQSLFRIRRSLQQCVQRVMGTA